MKNIIPLISFILIGCANKQDTTQDIATTAKQTLDVIQMSLPKECQTETINKQILTTKASIDTIVSTCDIQKDSLTQEKVRWKWAFLGLLLVVLVNFIKKLTK